MSWFRLYDDILDDPKVQRLSPDTFRGWINILCLAKRHDGILPSTQDIAFALRMTEQSAEKLLLSLQDAGLVDVTDNGFEPHNWGGRQYRSDVSNDRVKRYRERQRNGDGNVTVTAHVTCPETETETETEKKEEEPPLVSPLKSEPEVKNAKRPTRLPSDWQPSAEDRSYAEGRGFVGQQIEDMADNFREHFTNGRGRNDTRPKWSPSWQRWVRTTQPARLPAGQPRQDKPRAKTFIETCAELASRFPGEGVGADRPEGGADGTGETPSPDEDAGWRGRGPDGGGVCGAPGAVPGGRGSVGVPAGGGQLHVLSGLGGTQDRVGLLDGGSDSGAEGNDLVALLPALEGQNNGHN